MSQKYRSITFFVIGPRSCRFL